MSEPKDEPKVLTTGRLDGLVITPFRDDEGKIKTLIFTVKDLPGLHLVLEAAAATELRDALTMIFDDTVR